MRISVLKHRATLLAAVVALTITPAVASQYQWSDVERVVVFGDVHGAYGAMRQMLLSLAIIDERDQWIAGATHLVSLGDLLDRGGESRQTMDLLMQLQAQAPRAGGRVHVLIGNHELMNLTGDLRYVSVDEYRAFADDEEASDRAAALQGFHIDRGGETAAAVASTDADFAALYPPGFFAHRKAFSRQGKYGSWLLAQNVLLVINDTAFAHGGFPLWLADHTLGDINQRFQSELRELLELGERLVGEHRYPRWTDLLDPSSLPQLDERSGSSFPWARFTDLQNSPLFGVEGPAWYRGTAQCHPLIERSRLLRVLDKLQLERVVLGHTPTADRRIQQRFDGQVILADTGMLASYYHGQPAAISISGSALTALYPVEESSSRIVSSPDRLYHSSELEKAFADALNDSDTTPASADGQLSSLNIDGAHRQVRFHSGSTREVKLALAAYRLDRELNLGVVPLTVSSDSPRGTYNLLPGSFLTETERAARGLTRPNPCGRVNDYQLMYAFDALIRNVARTSDSILYDQATWELQITGYTGAFGNATSFPDYLQSVPAVIPKGFADTLSSLNAKVLDKVLGDLLSARQRRGVLARRDKLLATWRIAD